MEISCGIKGSQVKVIILGDNKILSLCEVEVYVSEKDTPSDLNFMPPTLSESEFLSEVGHTKIKSKSDLQISTKHSKATLQSNDDMYIQPGDKFTLTGLSVDLNCGNECSYLTEKSIMMSSSSAMYLGKPSGGNVNLFAKTGYEIQAGTLAIYGSENPYAEPTVGFGGSADKWRQLKVHGNFLSTGSLYNGGTSQYSDRRLKRKIQTLNPQGILRRLTQLKPVLFRYKNGSTSIDPSHNALKVGWIAQDVVNAFPELVREESSARGNENNRSVQDTYGDGEKGYLSVSYMKMVPNLIMGLQELEERRVVTSRLLAELRTRDGSNLKWLLDNARTEVSGNKGIDLNVTSIRRLYDLVSSTKKTEKRLLAEIRYLREEKKKKKLTTASSSLK
jgi:hypothetical protein